jgi:hypothetical protein
MLPSVAKGSLSSNCWSEVIGAGQHLIAPTDFVEELLRMKFRDCSSVLEALQERYRHGRLGNELVLEKEWLQNVRDLLLQSARRGTARSRLRQLVKLHIAPSLEQIGRP